MPKWTTESKIGDLGGFGIVYKSRKKANEKFVNEKEWFAKKRLNRLDEDSIKRFQKEVRLSQRLNHPRIIEIIASNIASEPYFYIMPLYKHSMQSIMMDLKVDYNRIKTIFNQIFDGVEYLHSEGVYHRDLKPANILMNSDTDLVISDFGLGLKKDSSSIRLTETGMGMGTYFFSSPEQLIDAKNVDHRTDIYSLGCMIYLCFIPEEWDTRIALEKMPPGIDYVIRKSTAYNKEERFPNIESFRQSFNAGINQLIGIKKLDRFGSIIEQMKTGDSSDEFINKLIINFNSYIDDPDKIHEAIISISPEQFRILSTKHFEASKRVIKVFKEHITSQGWPFNYTDTIGRQCFDLYKSTEYTEIKTLLIYIIIQVGVSHNRWYVMNLARKILESIKNDSEAFEVASSLKDLDWEIDRLQLEKKDLYGELKNLIA